jgi:hypothetical protein
MAGGGLPRYQELLELQRWASREHDRPFHQMEREHVQPVVEIQTKPPGSHGFL